MAVQAIAVGLLLPISGLFASRALSATAPPAASGGCQFLTSPGAAPAFCDTLGVASPTSGSRSGDLNGTVWGVSRATSYDNMPQGVNYNWASVGLNQCGTTVTATDPSDVRICNGRMVEAVNDSTNQTVLAMYPRQPFDIAGRTGTVAFDVSDNTQGPHAAWPEFVYTDQPVPAPMATDLPGVADTPRNSVAVSFGGINTSCCTPPTPPTCVGVDQIGMTSNYQRNSVPFNQDGCVVPSTGVNSLNHVEIQMSPTTVKVYMSDAGTTNMHLVADASLTMPLTRGLLWMEDVHYNAGKFNTQQSNTFAWANFGFDGPLLPRDLGFDVPDNKDAGSTAANGLPTNNNGYVVPPTGSTLNLAWPSVTGVEKASGALLELNYWPTSTQTLTYSINGNPPHHFAWPFGNSPTYMSQTVAMPVPVSELHDGANTVAVSTSDGSGVSTANYDLILVGAGGIVPPGGSSSGTTTTVAPTTAPPTTAPPTTAPPTTAPPTTAPPTTAPPTPAAPVTVTLDKVVSADAGPGTSLVSPTLTTSQGNELLVAFVSSDGPSSGAESFTSVTGGGLTWTRAGSSNSQPGAAEIWEAFSPNALSNIRVTAARNGGSYEGSITVAAFAGASRTPGALAVGAAGSGASTVSVKTTAAGSWVWGVGHDWDNGVARTVGSGQTMVHQYVDNTVGDTSWVQRESATTPSANATVTISDQAPTGDRWDVAVVEIKAA